MLAIQTVTFREAEAIESRARAAYRTGAHAPAPDGGTPATADWLLVYAAGGRAMPYSWAPAVFRTLGDATDYAALVRGYLLTRGLDCLLFEAPEETDQ